MHFKYFRLILIELLESPIIDSNMSSAVSWLWFIETREGRLASRCQGEIQTGMQEDVCNISGDGNSQDQSTEDTHSLVSFKRSGPGNFMTLRVLSDKIEIKCNYLINGPKRIQIA